MRTHENAPENDPQAQVDFCWNIHYVQMNNIYCDVMNNGPLQAWRAGFREGVKMGLVDGNVVDPSTPGLKIIEIAYLDDSGRRC